MIRFLIFMKVMISKIIYDDKIFNFYESYDK
jgi:hypothetical protein